MLNRLYKYNSSVHFKRFSPHHIHQFQKESYSDDDDKEIYTTLILRIYRNNPDEFKNINYHFLINKSWALALVARNGLIYTCLSQELQNDPDICSEAIKQNSTLKNYIPENRKKYLLSLYDKLLDAKY